MNYELRKAAGESDSLFLYELKKLVLRPYVEKIWGWDEAVQLQYHAENYHPQQTSIILVNGQNAGTIEIQENAEQLFICSLYLLPQYQGNGIGTSLVRQYMQQAQQQKKRLSLEVLQSNTRARKLYETLGLVTIPTTATDIKIFMYKDYAP
jgi:ribosomal protein S18 acetylase RimI-like enzyme